MGEAKTYAEDKLALAGYQIEEGEFRVFRIDILSERDPKGLCYGRITVEMFRSGYFGGLFGKHVVAMVGTTFTGHEDANTMVLDEIKKLIDETQ